MLFDNVYVDMCIGVRTISLLCTWKAYVGVDNLSFYLNLVHTVYFCDNLSDHAVCVCRFPLSSPRRLTLPCGIAELENLLRIEGFNDYARLYGLLSSSDVPPGLKACFQRS